MAVSTGNRTEELSLTLQAAFDTKFYVRLSVKEKVILISLSSALQDAPTSSVSMGSFVYALPNRYNDTQPLATTLFSQESSLDFTTRLAKLLARKTQMPVYVTNSIRFSNGGMGEAVEEEMETFKAIIQLVLQKLKGDTAGQATAGLKELSLQ